MAIAPEERNRTPVKKAVKKTVTSARGNLQVPIRTQTSTRYTSASSTGGSRPASDRTLINNQPISSVPALNALRNSMISKAAPKPTNANPLSVLRAATPAKKAPAKAPVKAPALRPAATSSRVPAPVAHAPAPVVHPISPGANTARPVTSAPAKAPAPAPAKSTAPAITNDYDTRAKYAVGVELDPQEAAMKQSALQSDQRFNWDQANAAANTQRAVNEQGDVYSRLNQSLQGQLPAVANVWDQDAQRTNSNYEALKAALGTNYDSGVSRTSDEAARLGLDPAVAASTAQMGSDKAFLTGLAGVNQAGAQDVINNGRSLSLQDALNTLRSSGREGANLQGQTIADYQSGANQAKFDQGQNVSDLNAQYNALEGTRAGKIYETKVGMQQAQAALDYQHSQDQIQNDLAYGNLGVKQQLAGSTAQLNAAHASSYSAQAVKDQAAAQAQLAQAKHIAATSDPNSVEYAQAMAVIAKDQAQAHAAQASAQATANKPAPLSAGYPGSVEYITRNVPDPAARQNLLAVANDVINRVNAVTHAGKGKQNAAALFEARKQADAHHYTPAMQQVLFAAVNHAYPPGT